MENDLCELAVWCLDPKMKDKKFARKVLKDFVFWKWSERHGKIKGCKYWSEIALHSYNDLDAEFKHEHVIPRSYLANKLISKYPNGVTKNQIQKDLNKFCIGCVITEDEDDFPNDLRSNMPLDWDWNDGNIWKRYGKAMKIWELSWDKMGFKKVKMIEK
jgi:hypothetical protein